MENSGIEQFELENGARFSGTAVIDAPSSEKSSGITERKVFRGDRRLYAKQLAMIGFFVMIGIVLFGYFGIEERNPKFYGFMCGLGLVILAGRYFSMMGLNGPGGLAFDVDGITVLRGKKPMQIPWVIVRSIRNEVIRGGQLWEIKYAGGKYDYFVDGLTAKQKQELRDTIASINLEHVKVRLVHFDPMA